MARTGTKLNAQRNVIVTKRQDSMLYFCAVFNAEVIPDMVARKLCEI